MLKDCSIRLRSGKRIVVNPTGNMTARILSVEGGTSKELGHLYNFRDFENDEGDIGRLLYMATYDKRVELDAEERIELRSKIIRDSRWARWLAFFTASEHTWGVQSEQAVYGVNIKRNEGILESVTYTFRHNPNQPNETTFTYTVKIKDGLGDFLGDDSFRKAKMAIIGKIQNDTSFGLVDY